MSKRSKQVTLTSLFGPGPSTSPNIQKIQALEIIGESAEATECSSIDNYSLCFMIIMISSSGLAETSRIF
jgi:hypothetical protein